MNIKMDHINLTVSDINESRTWYQQLFGFNSVERGLTAQNRKFEILANNDFMICMSEYDDVKRDDGLKREHHRIYHFGIRVADENEWISRIQSFGLKIKYGGVVLYPYSRSWYIEDPNGHEIEVSYSDKPSLKFPNLEHNLVHNFISVRKQ